MKKRTLFVLFIILLLAGCLRFWQLSRVPVSLDWDDVSVGYNAYSILKTGKDEFGNFLPPAIRSLDDYKPAMYTYFSVPSIAIFGLNSFAVRFPNALFGTLTVLFFFFLVREIFKKDEISLVSAFLFAISSWSIQFSRFAHETNIALGFNILITLFFLKGLKKAKYLLIAGVLSGLSLYTYQSAKIFTPLLILSLVLIFRKELFILSRKIIASSIVLGFLICLPMFLFILTNTNSLSRAKDVGFLSNTTRTLGDKYVQKITADRNSNDLIGLIVDNRRIVYAKTFINNYLSHFDLNWLFITGDSNIGRHQPPRMGHLYLIELPFLMFGLFLLFFGKYDKKIKLLVFYWILITPIAAAISWDVPNAGRTLNFLPMFMILIALGILESIRFKKYLIFPIVFLFTFNFIYYLNQYFVQQNYFQYFSWQYGYEKIVPQIQEIEKNYKEIIVSNRSPLEQSYIFFLFYLKYPPQSYQEIATSGAYGVKHEFAKYKFDQLNWQKGNPDILYIGGPNDFPTEALINFKKIVYNPNGSPAMLAVSGE
ncbi:MAG: hypothetical protein ACD_37C00135G0002 [uncultured bacterium]|nr:MAG: hypothetical protein ACD_37C00135G0002 [uncultured bacterium]OGH43976.1 MAG: hypothetical protein A3I49_00975 [Candidatus Levybacteria bacterium RIFCSPLOWO2_02_FULL_37_11]